VIASSVGSTCAATKVSVNIPDEVLQTARRRSGDGGSSAYVAGAVELANRLAA